MTAYSIFEALVVGAVVLGCLYSVAKRFAPRSIARLRMSLGKWMEGARHPGWMRAWGHRLAVAQLDVGGCGSGCGSCGSCAPPANDPAVHPIHVERGR